MSKVDAQRALREARYARFAATKTAEPVKKKPAPEAQLVELFAVEPPPPAPAPTPTPAPEVAEKPAEPEASAHEAAETIEELCGHKSINGKSCTREKGHPQKNHRYA